jgi:hypothetical protein
VLPLLTVAIALLLAAPAFANTGTKSGGYWPYSSTAKAFVALDGSVIVDATDSPHSGYTTTTGKCKVCHAVHGAGSTDATGSTLNETEVLLRTSKADLCTFCHLTGAFATGHSFRGSGMLLIAAPASTPGTDPYQGDPTLTPDPIANYAGTEGGSGHFSGHQGTPYSGCTSCHSIHAGDMLGTGVNMLKNDPAKGVVSLTAVDGGYGSRKAPVTTLTDFCLDCHDGTQWIGTDGKSNPIVSSAQFSAQFPACAGGCHNSVSPTITANDSQFGVAFNQGHNGRSHPMTESLTGTDGSTPVADHVTLIPAVEGPLGTSCATCHSLGSGGDFPHYLSRDQALIQGFTYLTQIDGVCLGCHSKVGTSF